MRKLRIAGIVAAFLVVVLSVWYIAANREVATLDEAARRQLGGTYLSLPNGVVHYELTGDADKPVVVLVHGFSTPYLVWDRTVEAVRSAGYRVLRFDLYGRGYSDRPDSDYGLDLYVDQLGGMLDSLKLQAPVHIVAMSMGGPTAARFAHRNPERVASLTLIAPLVETPSSPQAGLLKLPLVGGYLSKVVLIPKVRGGLDRLVFDPSVFPDWERTFDSYSRFDGYARALWNSLRYLNGKNFIEDYQALARTRKPVQVIWGLDDRTVPYRQHEPLVRALPGVSLHTLERCGHLPHYEHPAQVNALLLAFLSAQSR